MQITIHYAKCRGKPQNIFYPCRETISSEAEFARVVAYDHMFSSMRDNRRNMKCFVETSALAADIDNDHSEDPDDWFSPEDIADSFPDVAYIAYTSRSHMKQKGGKSPRPRFHVVFPITTVTDPAAYAALMNRLHLAFPAVDSNAIDAARFFFGNPDTEVYFHPASKNIDRFLDEMPVAVQHGRKAEALFQVWSDQQSVVPASGPIPEGSRNKAMHLIAVRLLKRYGDTEETYAAYLKEADRCSPPLPEAELTTSWNSACAFYHNTISKQPGYVQPEQYGLAQDCPPFIIFTGRKGEAATVHPSLLADYIRERVPFLLVQDSGLNDTLLYVYDHGVYKVYSEKMMLGLIKEPVQQYNLRLVSMPKIREAYSQLMTDPGYTPIDALDANESIVNFQNGLLYITADELRFLPHTPKVYSTIQLSCDWIGEETSTPVFDRFLSDLTSGNEEEAQLLLQYMGACFSNVPGWRMKQSLFLVGPGDTGKSQLKSLTEKILGRGNYISADLQDIERRFGTGSIYGTRLIGSSDMSFMTVDELKTFKKFTGGDNLFAEFKGKQAFSHVFKGLSWFCANALPKFGGDDGSWVYDRFLIVRCGNVIPKEKQDHTMLDKLYEEREGIIYKAMKALQTVIADGFRFSEPESVKLAREEYHADNSTPIRFYNECMCARKANDYKDRCSAQVIYDAYKAWCNDNVRHGYHKTAKEFRDTLAAHFGTTYDSMKIHREDGNYYKGLTLKPEVRSQYLGLF